MHDDETSRSTPYGEFGRGVRGRSPEYDAGELLRIVQDGDDAARFAVASEENMPVEGIAVLALHQEPGIRGSVLANSKVPMGILEQMVKAFPEMRGQIAVHPNAPLPLMDSAPLVEHTQLSLIGYLRRRGASGPQREAMFALHGEHVDVTLGEAWNRVTAG